MTETVKIDEIKERLWAQAEQQQREREAKLMEQAKNMKIQEQKLYKAKKADRPPSSESEREVKKKAS